MIDYDLLFFVFLILLCILTCLVLIIIATRIEYIEYKQKFQQAQTEFYINMLYLAYIDSKKKLSTKEQVLYNFLRQNVEYSKDIPLSPKVIAFTEYDTINNKYNFSVLYKEKQFNLYSDKSLWQLYKHTRDMFS